MRCILTGPSPRECTTGRHAIVGDYIGLDGFELLHDPHESQMWLDGEPTHAVFFVPLTTPATPTAAEECVETIQTRTGHEWVVRLSKDMLTISDEHGEILHRSRGHILTGVYLAMLIEWYRNQQATPSAAVGADGPGAGDAEAKRIISIANEREEFVTDVDGFVYYWPSKGGHLSAWQLRVIADELDSRNKPWQEQIEKDLGSKPTNCINPESEDTPPHNPVMGPVVGTATVTLRDWCQKSSGTRFPDPSPPAESPATVQSDCAGDGRIEALEHVLSCIRSMLAAGRNAAATQAFNDVQTVCLAAIQRLIDGESIGSTSHVDVPPPAESPDDWVMITDPKHVLRSCDEVRYAEGSWHPCRASVGATRGTQTWEEFRCRRRDLPVVPVVPKTRTVELSEHRYNHSNKMTVWSSRLLPDMYTTGRTCVTEVPE